MTEPSDRLSSPVPVEIKNWPDPPAKLPLVKNSTVRTVLLAPGGDGTSLQISDYEPKRLRMVLIVLDAPVEITDSVPTISVDASTATTKPGANGGILPNGIQPYEFFGPDAWWLTQLGTVTRVTIIKEFG